MRFLLPICIVLSVAMSALAEDSPTLNQDIKLPLTINGKKVGEVGIKAGTKVAVIQRKDGMAQIKSGSGEGWVKTVVFVGEEPTPTPAPTPTSTPELKRISGAEASAAKKVADDLSETFYFDGLTWKLEYTAEAEFADRPPNQITFSGQEPTKPDPPGIDPAGPASTEIKRRKWLSTVGAAYQSKMMDFNSKNYTLSFNQADWVTLASLLKTAKEWREKSAAASLPEGIDKPLGTVGDKEFTFVTPSTLKMGGRVVSIDDLLKVVESVSQMNSAYVGKIGGAVTRANEQVAENEKIRQLLERQEQEKREKVDNTLTGGVAVSTSQPAKATGVIFGSDKATVTALLGGWTSRPSARSTSTKEIIYYTKDVQLIVSFVGGKATGVAVTDRPGAGVSEISESRFRELVDLIGKEPDTVKRAGGIHEFYVGDV
jgi:hypothetical protein